MNTPQSSWESWIFDPTNDSQPPTDITSWSRKLFQAIHKRAAHDSGAQLVPSCEDDFEQFFYDESGRIGDADYLGEGSMLFRDRFGSAFLATIRREDGRFFLTVGRVNITIRKGAIDVARDVIFATHHTIDRYPDNLPVREVIDGPIDQAFYQILVILNELIDRTDDRPRERIAFTTAMQHLSYVDAGALSYTSGIFGAALFMATSIGPGWLGFLVSYLPMSILTVLAASAHE